MNFTFFSVTVLCNFGTVINAVHLKRHYCKFHVDFFPFEKLLYMRSAQKLMPPVLFSWPMSEVDVGFMAV